MKEDGQRVSNPGLALILQVVRKNRDRNTIISLILAVCCGTYLGWRLSIPVFFWEGGNVMLAAGLIAAVAYAGMEQLRHNATADDFEALLSTQANRLVWVYYLKVDIQPFGVHVRQTTTLFFWLDNHSNVVLRATEAESIAIMNAIRSSLPHASFGYSLQKEQLYRADPALLRR
ncbi:MAG: hypothetical protein GC205_01880 [Bacteroidetes bacterium]|nr:hypothetical protein [Bacteroidota bacterium]